MKNWSDFLNSKINENDFTNPIENIDRYVNGLTGKLRLIRPEEVETIRPKLMELMDVLQRILQ